MSEHYTVNIIFNSRIYWGEHDLVVAKFQAGKSKTIYSKVKLSIPGVSSCFDCYNGIEEYSVVFHTKSYCYTFLLYAIDGKLEPKMTWGYKKVYSKKDKQYEEERQDYTAQQITIKEIVQKRLCDE